LFAAAFTERTLQMMRSINIRHITAAVIAALLLTSCKSVKNLSAKDNSTAKKTTIRKKPPRKVTFIDGIEVQAGETVATKQSTKTASKKVTYTKPDVIVPTGFTIEKADWLQLKYAIMLNETVENLLNLSLLRTIDQWWGTRYCIGGNTTNCTDCSAFSQTVLRDAYGMAIPRTAQEQYDVSEQIDLRELKEGNLVFFYTGGSRSITHVGVYLSNNKFVHASTSNGVMISDLSDNYWKPRYRGAGRMHGVAAN
jgi:hypothetical protein